MNTIDEAGAAAEDPSVIRESMRKLLGKFSPATTPKKAERKQRERKAHAIADGRSLRAKGRSEQLNVKVRPDIKQALAAKVEAEGITIADWIERTLEAALGLGGN